MTEGIYIIDQADVQQFVGLNNCNLVTLMNLYPKAKIRLQGKVLKVLASEVDTERILGILHTLEETCVYYNQLTEEQIISAVRGAKEDKQAPKIKQEKNVNSSDLILYGLHGKAISARGESQKKMIKAFEEKDLIFAEGPAGSGKTFIAIALAVKALKTKQVRKIILSRPAVEAGEKLGFLPGEMKDKLDPYLQPLYDALGELIPNLKLKEMIDTGIIEIAPLAFMRGRTLNNAVVILDEAQNTSCPQMKMFLTRLGFNSKMIVTGDSMQVDLPKGVKSGLRDAIDKFSKVSDIAMIHFNKTDIVRHSLVQAIVEIYEQNTEEKK